MEGIDRKIWMWYNGGEQNGRIGRQKKDIKILKNRFEKAVDDCKNVGMDRKIVEGLFKN